MKEFPNRLKPENKEKFPEYCFYRNLAYLRRDIFELMILGDENNYFALDNFSYKHGIPEKEMEELTNTVVKELENLGWNTKTSFGGTGLFIYSTKDPPPSCYVDEL